MNDGNCQPELSPAAGWNSGKLSQLSGEMKDSGFWCRAIASAFSVYSFYLYT